MSSRVYVDNAATSWPKPAAVVEAVASYLTDCGAPAGRSGYADALEVDHKIESTRRHLAKTLGVADPRCLAFSANGTDALNQAMFGTLHPGDRVITSVAEHNSVLRPLRYLEETRDVQVERCRVRVASVNGDGNVGPDPVGQHGPASRLAVGLGIEAVVVEVEAYGPVCIAADAPSPRRPARLLL